MEKQQKKKKLPKTTKGIHPLIVLPLPIFLFCVFFINNAGMAGSIFGNWLGNYVIIVVCVIGIKNFIARKTRAKVYFEVGDADVFSNKWSDTICVVVMGVIVNFINSTLRVLLNANMEIILLADITCFAAFYYVYHGIYNLAELELYAKYNKIRKYTKNKKQ